MNDAIAPSFSRTERALHWIHAAAFFVLLGSGLVLYVPKLSELGFEIVANTPEQFAQFQAGEDARWKTVIQTAKIEAN